MSDMYTLQDLLYLLGRKWKGIAASVCAGLIVFFLISAFVLPKQYMSTVELYVNSNTTVQNGDKDLNDINASQKLVNTYIVILQNEEVLSQVAARLDGKIPVKDLRGLVSMRSVNQTEVLQIVVETKDADLSAKICNVFADIAPTVLQRVVKAGSVEVIGRAKPATEPSSPHTKINSLIGAVAGLVLSVGFVLVRSLMDNTVKGEEDVRQRLDIPVLGEIPTFIHEVKGGARRA